MTAAYLPHGVWITARLLLVCMFPFSGLAKLLNWNQAMKQASSSFLPAPALMLVLAMLVEIATPVCIVAGWWPRQAALLLIIFCIATAVLYHPFWKGPDFWVRGISVARNNFWDFTKNLGLAGGLLLVALGAGF
ncbi:MAG: DoxX family protein [Pseudomonadota bacterium]|nr:DoxX family protein [Pseudomonadota bacterium]